MSRVVNNRSYYTCVEKTTYPEPLKLPTNHMSANHLQDLVQHHHLSNEQSHNCQQLNTKRTEGECQQHLWNDRPTNHQQNDHG